MAVRNLENPLPHIVEAKDAALKIFTLQRELLLLDTELKAKERFQKVALLAASLVSLMVGLIFALFWCTIALRDRGWSAGSLAIITLLFFAATALVLVLFASRVGKGTAHETRKTDHAA